MTLQKRVPKSIPKTKGAPKRKKFRKFIPLYLMMVPSFLYLIINNYLPMFGLVIAFKNVNFKKGIWGSDWAGLDNFKYLFATEDAWVITRNTLLYNIVFILVHTTLAVIAAIILSELTAKKSKRFYQSVILLPYLISMVIISYLVNAFLSSETGFINNTVLPLLHIDKVSWYTDAGKWPFILVFVDAWKNVGYLSIIYYSAVIGIDREYLECAALEGATKLQQIRKIVLPLISPVITIMVLLAVGKIFFSDFGLFYQVPMDSGPLYPTTNVISTYVYRGLMQLGDIGMSSAAGLYQSVVGFVLVLLSNLVVRKLNPENALF